MATAKDDIGASYEQHYATRSGFKVYPPEFVVRTFLARYPKLNFPGLPVHSKVLDVGFGDGRNTGFLCDRGFDVSGIEITPGIVAQTKGRLAASGYDADLRVGRNSAIPFEDRYFDCVLACHSCYYCDESEPFARNLAEYARVLKDNGFLVASIADRASYIFEGAEPLADGSMLIRSDPYGNRRGSRLHAFGDTGSIETYLSPLFSDFSFGSAHNDYYGIAERVFWVVCRKRSRPTP